MPKGHNSERSNSERGTGDAVTEQQRGKKEQSAERAPGAGQPRWPAPGARWEYGGNCSSNRRDTKISMGKLTDATWTKVGLRPTMKGPSIFTDKTQPSRVYSEDPPPPTGGKIWKLQR